MKQKQTYKKEKPYLSHYAHIILSQAKDQPVKFGVFLKSVEGVFTVIETHKYVEILTESMQALCYDINTGLYTITELGSTLLANHKPKPY